MKIGSLALGNAIKIGSKTTDFLSHKNYDMSLDGITLKVADKNGLHVCYTTLFNTKWWHPLEQVEEQEAKAGTRRKK